MALPVIFGPLTAPQMSELDEDFAAVGALTVIPCTAVGTNSIALTPFADTPALPSYANYELFSFKAAADSSASVSLNVNGLGAKNLYLSSGAAAGSGALVSGTLYIVAYVSTLAAGSGGFQIMVGQSVAGASAPPIRGSFKNLTITNGGTPNSQVVVTADEIIVQTSTSATYKASTVSLTISTLASGANGLDTGSVANSTWYSVWAIYNGTAVAGLLSTSATTPTLPGGYTYSARIGWVRTDGAAALLRIKQKGDEASYINASLPIMDSGADGSVTVPTWVAIATGAFVPSTASHITINVVCSGSSAIVMVAPNNSYGASNSTTNTPPIVITSSGAVFDSRQATFLLESTNIYWAAVQTGNVVTCAGWRDNL